MKYRVKSLIPSIRKPGVMEKYNFWVFGSNTQEAEANANARIAHVVAGTGGVLKGVWPNKGRDLKGGIGEMPLYRGA
jgi:hypothetical protein